MILFKLRCSANHEFDGWFRDNAAFDRQQARGQIACPVCGENEIEKAPMAPRLGRSRGETPEPRPAGDVAEREKRPPTPAEMRRALQEMRRRVEAHCEHVGPRFADEARRIHRGEAKERGIYGDATPAESEKLAEEGIEIAAIPWLPLNDA